MAFDSFSPASRPETRDAFDAMYRAHAASLTRLAIRVLDAQADEADDVVQEAFLDLIQSGRVPSNPKQYLAAIVRRKAANIRQVGRYRVSAEQEEERSQKRALEEI